MPIRILLVEDEPLVRELIREYLGQDPTLEIIAETTSGEEAVRLATEHQPDVVLMDLSLEGMDGLKATKNLKKKCRKAQVIILTGYQFEDLRERAREDPKSLGVAGFLSKDEIPKRLLAVVQSVAGEASGEESSRKG